MADWHVVSMVSEPPQLVFAFVAHWLDRGAGHVHLHLDAPDEEVERGLAQVSGCSVRVLDAAYWAGRRRDWPQADRQRAMLTRVYAEAPAPWLLHVDADEALRPDLDLGAVLARLPEATNAVRLGVVERVHAGAVDPTDIFAGAFRRPTPRPLADLARRIDGDDARFLHRGMTGHAGGKSLVRTGLSLTVDIHGSPDAGRPLPVPDALLHFDGMTPRNWGDKKLRTIAQQPKRHQSGRPPRQAQFAYAHAHREAPEALADLYRRLRVYAPDRMEALREAGLLLEMRHDPRPSMARILPGLAPDLSVAGFDAVPLPVRPRDERPPGLLSRLRRRIGG